MNGDTFASIKNIGLRVNNISLAVKKQKTNINYWVTEKFMIFTVC